MRNDNLRYARSGRGRRGSRAAVVHYRGHALKHQWMRNLVDKYVLSRIPNPGLIKSKAGQDPPLSRQPQAGQDQGHELFLIPG